MKNVFFLFCFCYIVNFILCFELEYKNISLTDCFAEPRGCYNFTNNSCALIEVDKSNYEEMKYNSGEDIEELSCGTFFERCRQKYSNDIKENCYEVTLTDDDKKIIKENYECCYMTLEFEENKKHECYPAIADKKKIKEIIKNLKEKDYYELKNAKIKCNKSQYINFGIFILFNILFLF